jgi:hypothetical protein
MKKDLKMNEKKIKKSNIIYGLSAISGIILVMIILFPIPKYMGIPLCLMALFIFILNGILWIKNYKKS